jgi:hypothetical protein
MTELLTPRFDEVRAAIVARKGEDAARGSVAFTKIAGLLGVLFAVADAQVPPPLAKALRAAGVPVLADIMELLDVDPADMTAIEKAGSRDGQDLVAAIRRGDL